MSHWNGEKIVRWPPQTDEKYPGWDIIDCGCCVGLEWGGEYPRECKRCGGQGVVYQHRKSKVIAEYPGGPFC